jgi:asparagine synthase (glutamine-hydrolysing)
MSGIAGMVGWSGGAVDRAGVERMTAYLAFRGPDARGVWTGGEAGLGHALLRTTEEAGHERQPATLDGLVWITADARVDGRADLIRELRAGGRDCPATATDAQLILHAYALWGEQAVAHLIGDFSFAIWDSGKRKLFCARDPFGVKPFFYAQAGDSFLFSNTLDCVRLCPGVSDELDEQFIADFLLFELTPDLDRTAFRAVRRLPPAHTLVAAGGEVRVRRYWSLPVDPPTVYKNSRDYVERFQELFGQAVGDRMRARRVGILMSGGLDSTSVAAMAKKNSVSAGETRELRAHTIVYDRLVPYQERHYAGIAARGLGIPIDYFVADGYGLFEGWDDGRVRFSEPINHPTVLMGLERLREIAGGARVALSGYGGDPALSSLISRHCRELVRQGRLGQLASDLGRYLAAEGRLSRLYLRTRLARWFQSNRPPGGYPNWLDPEFEKRLNLRARWEEFGRRVMPEGVVRPEAYEILIAPTWPDIFEGYDTGRTGALLEARHPFFDLRLLRYLLSLPALPWCSDKEILRVAMKGQLPEEIRLRRKTLMTAHPFTARRGDLARVLGDRFVPVPELARFVRWSGAPAIQNETGFVPLLRELRPITLNFWLKLQPAFVYNLRNEEGSRELDTSTAIKETL